MKVQTKLFLSVLLPAVLSSVFGLFFIYNLLTSIIVQNQIDKLSSVATILERRIFFVVESYSKSVNLVSSRTRLRNIFTQIEGEVSDEQKETLATIISDALVSDQSIKEITLLKISGEEVITTGEGATFSLEERANYISRAGSSTLVDIYKDKNNVVKVISYGPMVSNNQVIGYVELISDAAQIISITDNYSGLGESGEVLLARKNDSGDAVFLNPLRFDAGAALSRAIPKQRDNRPIIPAINGVETSFGIGEVVDYRGIPVLAVTKHIEPLEWGLVAKIDTAETLADVRTLFISFVIILVAMLITILIVSQLLALQFVSPLKSLARSAQNIGEGKFDIDVSLERNDELGDLAKAFETMSNRVQSSYADFEQKVSERTDSLEQARTILEQKLSELERINRVMIERELKMIELKKKLEASGQDSF